VGAAPYTNQIFDSDALVIKRLEAAAQCWCEKQLWVSWPWRDLVRRHDTQPWSPKQARAGPQPGRAPRQRGPDSFRIGSETLVRLFLPAIDADHRTAPQLWPREPDRRNGFELDHGQARTICRTVEDCAIVFNAIYGPDGIDQTLYDAPFNYDPNVLSKNCAWDI